MTEDDYERAKLIRAQLAAVSDAAGGGDEGAHARDRAHRKLPREAKRLLNEANQEDYVRDMTSAVWASSIGNRLIQEEAIERCRAMIRRDSPSTSVEGRAAELRGWEAANARMRAVFASEHYAGREALAAKLLGKSLGADDIIAVLAEAPKRAITRGAGMSPAQPQPDYLAEVRDRAAREEMLKALEETTNSAIDASGGSVGHASSAGALWDRAIAKVYSGQMGA